MGHDTCRLSLGLLPPPTVTFVTLVCSVAPDIIGSVASAIVARGLRRVFAPDLAAVDGIDLDIEPGRIFGFLGANGSGKTTTVRMLTTLLRPTEGSASVDGLDVEKDASKVRARVGEALIAVAALAVINMPLALLALRHRTA